MLYIIGIVGVIFILSLYMSKSNSTVPASVSAPLTALFIPVARLPSVATAPVPAPAPAPVPVIPVLTPEPEYQVAILTTEEPVEQTIMAPTVPVLKPQQIPTEYYLFRDSAEYHDKYQSFQDFCATASFTETDISKFVDLYKNLDYNSGYLYINGISGIPTVRQLIRNQPACKTYYDKIKNDPNLSKIMLEKVNSNHDYKKYIDHVPSNPYQSYLNKYLAANKVCTSYLENGVTEDSMNTIKPVIADMMKELETAGALVKNNKEEALRVFNSNDNIYKYLDEDYTMPCMLYYTSYTNKFPNAAV